MPTKHAQARATTQVWQATQSVGTIYQVLRSDSSYPSKKPEIKTSVPRDRHGGATMLRR